MRRQAAQTDFYLYQRRVSPDLNLPTTSADHYSPLLSGFFIWRTDMTLASLRDRVAVPVEWVAAQIAARPKAALVVWIASLAFTALVL
jgi:hypothetical protein